MRETGTPADRPFLMNLNDSVSQGLNHPRNKPATLADTEASRRQCGAMLDFAPLRIDFVRDLFSRGRDAFRFVP